MIDLVTWLRLQLDEDDRVARNAAPGPWEYQDIDSVGGGRVCDPTVAISHMHWDTDRVDPRIRRSVRDEEADGTGEHIARHDPERVLAEVTAKRRILDLHALIWRDIGWLETGEDGSRDEAYEELEVCGRCVPKHSGFGSRADVPTGPCLTVRLLALPYADREGYREEWRP